MILLKFNDRRMRLPQGPPLAGYPAPLRRTIFWYDRLSDRQRVQYALVAILFLLACGGYLLGLGSTIVLRRVEIEEEAALAAEPLPTEAPTASATAVLTPSEALATVTGAPALSPTAVAPTSMPPTPTPFSVPVIAEPPAVPRQLPAAPVVAPVAPAAPAVPRVTPTLAKQRNLETSKPEPPAASVATPTPGRARIVATVVATAVRQPTPTPTPRAASAPTTTLPTLAVPAATAPPARPSRAITPTPSKTPPTH